MKTISLEKIICESNRKYTKDTGFEQLVKSIEQYGIIEPPVVRKLKGDQYRIIAGRRRIEAARRLGDTEVECIIRDDGYPDEETALIEDEELALTENVNRQDMHPLDEAAAFKRMADAGSPVEEIARYYARSPSAIYKRLRLVPLIEELKNWFRDGILDIAGAALLAELPEETQKKFFDNHETRYKNTTPEDIEKYGGIDKNAISQFFYKQQQNKISGCLGEACQACEKRTHNSDNDLFEEFSYLDDVCLDGDCYRAKWYEAINLALDEKIQEYGPDRTDKKIIFRNGFPAQLYKKATHANFSNVKYDVLKDKDFEFTGETDRKKDACWEIRIKSKYSPDDKEEENEIEVISVRRVGYKERPKVERPSSRGETESGTDEKQVERYGKEAIKAVAAERGTTAVELIKELNKKTNSYNFKDEINELVYERIIARRIKADTSEVEPLRDYFSMFLQHVDYETDGCSIEGGLIEKNFNDRQKRWLNDILGKKSLKEYRINLPDDVHCEVLRLFHFLLLCFGFDNILELDELKDIEKKKNIFWEYAGIDKDEYRALYIEAAKEVAAKALEPKPKKGGKKNETADSGAAHGEDVPVDASSAGSSSSKRGKGRAKKSVNETEHVRKCRVCGFEDDACKKCDGTTCRAGCSWVEEDLCSECKKCRTCKHNSSCTLKDDPDFKEDYCDNWELPDETDPEDNYPFEPDPEEDPEI